VHPDFVKELFGIVQMGRKIRVHAKTIAQRGNPPPPTRGDARGGEGPEGRALREFWELRALGKRGRKSFEAKEKSHAPLASRGKPKAWEKVPKKGDNPTYWDNPRYFAAIVALASLFCKPRAKDAKGYSPLSP
jgi:hypothetical protein